MKELSPSGNFAGNPPDLRPPRTPCVDAVLRGFLYFLCASGLAETSLARADPGTLRAPAEGRPAAHHFLSSLAAPQMWLELDSDLRVSPHLLAGTGTLVRSWGAPTANGPGELGDGDDWMRQQRAGASLLLPTSNLLASDPQRPSQPMLALGGSSHSLVSLLRDAGLNAQYCMAPLMRMHSTIAGSGPRTNVSLSARCSFR